MAQRRAAEAEAKAQAGAAEAETQAQADAGAYEADEAGADEAGAYEADAGAYEAEAQAQADARAYEAQLHQLQPELQQREQQATDTQRLQHLQQQLQDLQQDELQRKEQQVAQQQQQVQQQQADLQLREQHVAQQHHQLQQQQADLQLREQHVAEQQHHLQQQQADLQQREQHMAEQQQHLQLQQQLNRLQQQLEAQSAGELQRQVQQQLAVQQHLLQQQHADLLLKQQHVEKQLQEDADQQGVSTNHPLPDHPPCSPHVPESLRSPLLKRPRQDTTLAPLPRERAWQPAAQTSATRATAQRVHRAAPTVLLTTRNRFATLPVVDEQEQQLPSQPARMDEHQAAAAAIAAAAVSAVLRAAAKAEAAGVARGREGHAQQGGGARAAGSGARSRASVGAMGRDNAMRRARSNPTPTIPHPPNPAQALSPRPVWDLRLHRQQQQQPQPLSTSPQAWQLRLQPLLDEFQQYPVEEGAELLDRLQQHRRMRSVVSLATGVVPPTPDQVLGGIMVESLRPVLASTKPMAACACSTCMSVPCLPCMKPDTTTPLEPMPMFQDTVKEVRDDEECYALLMWFYPNLLHDEVCFGKLTNTHCARYCQHMGLDRPKERRKLRRLVVRDLRSEQLEFEYEKIAGVFADGDFCETILVRGISAIVKFELTDVKFGATVVAVIVAAAAFCPRTPLVPRPLREP
ncbi:hypothetical protein QJQ45_001606 [Haematococcus lacustris]|nr:hypothetical protein QJQ45_001606 [Haematococcus lacustris]